MIIPTKAETNYRRIIAVLVLFALFVSYDDSHEHDRAVTLESRMVQKSLDDALTEKALKALSVQVNRPRIEYRLPPVGRVE